MDNYLFKVFRVGYKLNIDTRTERLHYNYQKCISNSIQQSFSENKMPNTELCIKEKQEFYNHLHEVDKIEHDNLMKYYHTSIISNNTSL